MCELSLNTDEVSPDQTVYLRWQVMTLIKKCTTITFQWIKDPVKIRIKFPEDGYMDRSSLKIILSKKFEQDKKIKLIKDTIKFHFKHEELLNPCFVWAGWPKRELCYNTPDEVDKIDPSKVITFDAECIK